MGRIIAPNVREDAKLADAELLGTLPILTFLRDSLVYRDVVAKLGPYCVARINPISSIAAMASWVRSGYGLATLPRAAIASALDSGELVTLEGVPDLAPLPVVACRRGQSESPLVAAVVHLAVEAAQVYSNSSPGLVVVDAARI